MITQQLLTHGKGLAERFGAGKVLACCALGCLLPIVCSGFFCCGLLLLLTEWR
jgi:hypothetical protein